MILPKKSSPATGNVSMPIWSSIGFSRGSAIEMLASFSVSCADLRRDEIFQGYVRMTLARWASFAREPTAGLSVLKYSNIFGPQDVSITRLPGV